MSIVSTNESNSILYMIRQMKLLFYNESNNPIQAAADIQKTFSFLESIMTSSSTTEIFAYLLHNEATTAWVLQVHLNMPEGTVYRCLKRLKALGVIVPATRLGKIRTKGGPRATVWSLPDASPESVARALNTHRRAMSPKYLAAEVFIQDLIDNYLIPRGEKRINRRDILQRVRDQKMPYSVVDITDIGCKILHERGIIVVQ